jgi:transposase
VLEFEPNQAVAGFAILRFQAAVLRPGDGDGGPVLALGRAVGVIEPFMPRDQPGPERKDDRQIISGILQVLTSGCRWRDCPAAYGPRTTVYNRFDRWSRRGFWKAILAALAKAGWADDAAALDSSYVRVHRSAHGGKGERRRKPSGVRAVARRPRSTRSPTCSAAQASCC